MLSATVVGEQMVLMSLARYGWSSPPPFRNSFPSWHSIRPPGQSDQPPDRMKAVALVVLPERDQDEVAAVWFGQADPDLIHQHPITDEDGGLPRPGHHIVRREHVLVREQCQAGRRDHRQGKPAGRPDRPVRHRPDVTSGCGVHSRYGSGVAATIRDVAKLAGVSIKTVSNVLNGYPHLTPATKGKVERALAELDYRPNIAARNLSRGRTGTVALAVPSLGIQYFAELANLVVMEAKRRGLTVLIDCTEGDIEREQLAAEAYRSRLIDGLILQPWSLSTKYLRERSDRTPLVLLGERVVRSIDSVAIDSLRAAQAAVEHLLELGRRRIGVIGAPGTARSGRRSVEPSGRHEGYVRALADADIPFDPSLVVTLREQAPDNVAVAVDELLTTAGDIDALFCFNDRLALGAVRTLIARGLRVPQDVAVIGIDDIEGGQLSTPSLSTIAPDKPGIAATAVEMLLERIERSDRPARHVVAGAELVARESTIGRPRRRARQAG